MKFSQLVLASALLGSGGLGVTAKTPACGKTVVESVAHPGLYWKDSGNVAQLTTTAYSAVEIKFRPCGDKIFFQCGQDESCVELNTDWSHYDFQTKKINFMKDGAVFMHGLELDRRAYTDAVEWWRRSQDPDRDQYASKGRPYQFCLVDASKKGGKKGDTLIKAFDEDGNEYYTSAWTDLTKTQHRDTNPWKSPMVASYKASELSASTIKSASWKIHYAEDENKACPATDGSMRIDGGGKKEDDKKDGGDDKKDDGGDDKKDGGASGDPHITDWSGKSYDYHGGCDLILLQNKNFASGMGMTIHIRTKINTWWSSIDIAVIQIGDDTLEVQGGEGAHVWVNRDWKLELQTGDAVLGDFPVHFNRVNDHHTSTRIDLGNGDAISIETFKGFVRVNVHGKSHKAFTGSTGLMGSYPNGDHVGRDGATVFEDNNEFGQEWMVLAHEPKLFHSESAVQGDKCVMPDQSKHQKRRLGEASIGEEQAALACARVSKKDRDACIFDVMATQDTDMAGSY